MHRVRRVINRNDIDRGRNLSVRASTGPVIEVAVCVQPTSGIVVELFPFGRRRVLKDALTDPDDRIARGNLISQGGTLQIEKSDHGVFLLLCAARRSGPGEASISGAP